MTSDTQDPAPREIRFFSDQLMLELGNELVSRNLVSKPQIDQLAARKALTGDDLDVLLLRERVVSEQDLMTVLADLTGITFRAVGEFEITPDVVSQVQPRAALRYHIMPLDVRQGIISVAVSRVPSHSLADSLRMLLNTAIEWVLCTETDINNSIKHFYGLGAETIDDLVQTAPVAEETQISEMDLAIDTTEEGIIKFVNQIISEAIRMNATDIHIEPYHDSLRLRYRIDGILQTIPMPGGVSGFKKPIASCVKIMADLNIAEKRKPHDGRIKVRHGGDEFDLRVSILPTPHGETVNMRILNRKSMFIDLEHLGISASLLPDIEDLAKRPHGVILLTGPTGSGKTTTLYALLGRVSGPDVKVITVEEPIEYEMEGINQIQVHSQIGLTFATILRSILRHDPDIVLIGEVRDSETADIAVRASLTGHLVFSTLHTNDAPSAITRLIDMGVEPYLVSSCLEGVIAQRLVRRVCDKCVEPMQPDDLLMEEILIMFPDAANESNFRQGKGCPNCNFTGYRGRVALSEVMLMTESIRELVVDRRPSGEIQRVALKNGMVTLRRDGWDKAIKGITSVNEVLRVAHRSEEELNFAIAAREKKNASA